MQRFITAAALALTVADACAQIDRRCSATYQPGTQLVVVNPPY
jgi:hypothetical protein